MAVVVTVAKGYDLGYVWKNQGQRESQAQSRGGEKTVGRIFVIRQDVWYLVSHSPIERDRG